MSRVMEPLQQTELLFQRDDGGNNADCAPTR